MPGIETINGRIDAKSLGSTLMHEHIFVLEPELQDNYPNPEWDEVRMISVAREGFHKLRQLGISTLVDVTVLGLGRNIPLIQRVCEGLGDFNVVAATGCYTYNELPRYFHSHGPGLRVDMDEPLIKMFVRDIRDGIANTGVKAAIIKIATDAPGFTHDVTRIFKAAVRAHLETGAPITTHSNAAKEGGLDQLRFFKEGGVDLSRVIIGHCGDSKDLTYLRSIMDSGCTIGMDRFGLTSYLGTDDRIETVVRLCSLGYADRMVLSQDAGFYSTSSEPSFRARMRPEWTHFLISERIIPELLRRGVTQQHVDQMMVANPARLLAMN